MRCLCVCVCLKNKTALADKHTDVHKKKEKEKKINTHLLHLLQLSQSLLMEIKAFMRVVVCITLWGM